MCKFKNEQHSELCTAVIASGIIGQIYENPNISPKDVALMLSDSLDTIRRDEFKDLQYIQPILMVDVPAYNTPKFKCGEVVEVKLNKIFGRIQTVTIHSIQTMHKFDGSYYNYYVRKNKSSFLHLVTEDDLLELNPR